MNFHHNLIFFLCKNLLFTPVTAIFPLILSLLWHSSTSGKRSGWRLRAREEDKEFMIRLATPTSIDLTIYFLGHTHPRENNNWLPTWRNMRFNVFVSSSAHSLAAASTVRTTARSLPIKRSTLDQRPVRNVDQIIIKPSLNVSRSKTFFLCRNLKRWVFLASCCQTWRQHCWKFRAVETEERCGWSTSEYKHHTAYCYPS